MSIYKDPDDCEHENTKLITRAREGKTTAQQIECINCGEIWTE